ncbi:MAG: hypothetical protein QXV73_04500 [Candidatus Micrarchaeia archaeon]
MIFLINNNLYRDTRYPRDENCPPLPWGTIKVISAYIRGRTYQSKGGAWYWCLPEWAVTGRGYCPSAEFYFTGDIIVTRERDFPPPYKWGWRVDQERWVYLDGRIYPSELTKIESLLSRVKILGTGEKIKQGSLKILPCFIDERDPYWGRAQKYFDSTPGRRRIYNHQFFGGGCKIFRIKKDTEEEYLLISQNFVHVVSPDHMDEPILLKGGVYKVTHPLPRVGD